MRQGFLQRAEQPSEQQELAASAQENSNVIVGLGQTGYSLARHLARHNQPFRVVDSRSEPPSLDDFQAEFPDVQIHLGAFGDADLESAQRLLVSPGVALDEPALEAAIKAGAEICSDIDLFCELVDAPIVAITGSNAKSTVTTLVGEMAQCAGLNAGVGGNIGVPVLDLLAQGAHEVYILELSSFQLDISSRLRADIACVLNLSADHLDRYPDLEAYRQSKQRIFKACPVLVNNLDDPQLPPVLNAAVKVVSFGVETSSTDGFSLVDNQGQPWLARGAELLMPVADMKIRGRHNYANALAALAIGHCMGLPMPAMLETLRNFAGLAHRCEWVAQINGVDFYNDSKGTNVGATIAALSGLGEGGSNKVVLIAGGDGKGADFELLIEPLEKYASAVMLIGRDGPALGKIIAKNTGDIVLEEVATIEQAVERAAHHANPGDVVLLSPACASTDMFSDYRARGQAFVKAVESL